MPTQLTEDEAIKSLRSFFREKPFLVFGTGMSCGLDWRFGMAALKEELVSKMQKCPLTPSQTAEWKAVTEALVGGSDLETALNAVSDEGLLRVITKTTGGFISEVDRQYAYEIAEGRAEWPATGLLKKLVTTLPAGDPVLHALTPNYDMLFEYACEAAGIGYANGFIGGVEQKLNWQAVNRVFLQPVKSSYRRRHKQVYKPVRHVRLYKVHGSLNYFFHRNNVLEINAWMWNPPDFAQRVMITPGISKYETLQRYRRELQMHADDAINAATHFLFLGYGFNDNHLDEYIRRKLIRQGCRGLIVTRDSNPRIEALLAEARNLWLVCKSEEANSEGTRISNQQYSNWLQVPEKRLWNVKEFASNILGG